VKVEVLCERPESSEFEVTYKDKFQFENAGIKTPIIGSGKSYAGIMVL
jgi:hypothetical protein